MIPQYMPDYTSLSIFYLENYSFMYSYTPNNYMIYVYHFINFRFTRQITRAYYTQNFERNTKILFGGK